MEHEWYSSTDDEASRDHANPASMSVATVGQCVSEHHTCERKGGRGGGGKERGRGRDKVAGGEGDREGDRQSILLRV